MNNQNKKNISKKYHSLDKLEHDSSLDKEFVSKNPICWKIIKLLSNNPFITQEEISIRIQISKQELIKNNKIIWKSEWAQNYIINEGAGSKYWENTILPSIQNGKAQAVLDEKYEYPDRIGLCPGLSCMFFCSFCGRNYSAAYERKFGEEGLEMFKQLIDQTPKTINNKQVYHITGGLEPLTFPRIGELISYADQNGFEMEMQTNGFQLTPDFVNKQSGIKDLSILRVSLYGVDDESTSKITNNKKAYSTVKRNLIDFLKLKLELKIGLNYVILRNQIKDLYKLLDFIEEINVASDNQIDFLTLREDFSHEADNISGTEREELSIILDNIQNRIKDKNLNKLHIDYGYALESIRKNKDSLEKLKRVTHKELRPKIFPQISIMIDPKGDVYAYHEAAFLDRAGSDRYSIGKVDNQNSLEMVIKNFVEKSEGIKPLEHDIAYMDSFDHVITILLNKLDEDAKFGIPISEGPINVNQIFN